RGAAGGYGCKCRCRSRGACAHQSQLSSASIISVRGGCRRSVRTGLRWSGARTQCSSFARNDSTGTGCRTLRRMKQEFRLMSIPIAAALALLLESGTPAQQQPPAATRWITAWGASQQGLGQNAVTNTTVRMIARVTVSGEAIRIRLDNTFGTAPLTVGKAYVGQRIQQAALAAGSNRQVFFNASPRVIVPPRGSVTSDPVAMHVLAQQDLAVTLYIPDADVRPSQHGGAQVTSYVAANGAGDVSTEETATPFTGTTTSMWWLKAIDVSSSSSTGAIVAFGDSITDGTCS